MQQVGVKCDPAPSKWAYRFERLMLTPLFRLVLRVFLPFLLVFFVAGVWLSNEDRRDQLRMIANDFKSSIQSRPEFMVNVMAIDGASTGIAEDILEIVPIDFPASSFDLDLDHIRERVAELPAVASATVRIRPGGIMQVTVTERDPAVLWRTREGLMLVDREGFVISVGRTRKLHAELPLIAGDGAENHVEEALSIYAAAGPLLPRVRGLVRMGERRWDLVLDRDQRILLPETGAVQALERVIALNQAQEMLARDLMVVDMRLDNRPTIRIAERAVEEWWRIRQLSYGNTRDK
ncbi:cell division protein FtsQ/DivIB [Shimia thalassica]|uniref:Cell division protein FtsQ n=1 Tax=Shimia thalassica TaxID=1715693 RepID=A0A0P1IP82_9RHOB|nr:cell division protein FtsQ/DivIB [Shimia thalassica]MDP2578616.1 cell division protein FtsQ/DivIB [Shimia thalassica]CUJ89752.1 cell division protein FtsQ [Shimia thalassica]